MLCSENLLIILFCCRRGHLFDYTSAVILYEMCVEEPNATVGHRLVFDTQIYILK